MEPPAVEDVQSGKNDGENRNINIYIALMREQLQEERKVCEKNNSKMLNFFREENQLVHLRLDSVVSNHKSLRKKVKSVKEKLFKKVNDLEDQIRTNKQNFEQQLQVKEKADNDKMKRRREKKLKRKSRSETTSLSPLNKSSYCLRKRDPSSNPLRSSTPPEMRRTRSEKRDSNTAKEDLIFLTERQLQNLMQGSDCVTFIGNLVLSSFPPGYFLEKKNSFSVAISSNQIDLLFAIVSSKYQVIQRRGRSSKTITKEEMKQVMKNKVTNFRTLNRQLRK